MLWSVGLKTERARGGNGGIDQQAAGPAAENLRFRATTTSLSTELSRCLQLALSKEERSAASWQHPLEPTVVPPAHSLSKLEGVMWRGCHQPKTYTVGHRPWV